MVASLGRNVEPNCIQLVRNLVTFELGITCQRFLDLPARRSMRRRGSVWRRMGWQIRKINHPPPPFGRVLLLSKEENLGLLKRSGLIEN